MPLFFIKGIFASLLKNDAIKGQEIWCGINGDVQLKPQYIFKDFSECFT